MWVFIIIIFYSRKERKKALAKSQQQSSLLETHDTASPTILYKTSNNLNNPPQETSHSIRPGYQQQSF
jgi:hypothetical protein